MERAEGVEKDGKMLGHGWTLRRREDRAISWKITVCVLLGLVGLFAGMLSSGNGTYFKESSSLLRSTLMANKDSRNIEECPKLHLDKAFVAHMELRILQNREAVFNRSKRIYVQHQFKCGGSTLCKYFRRTGLTVPLTHNCNGEFYLHKSTNLPYHQLDALLRHEPYSVVFNEAPMAKDDFHPERLVYLTTAREPKSRAVSSMLQAWKGLEMDEEGIVRNLSHYLRSYMRHGSFQGKTSGIPSNLQVLHLSGERERNRTNYDWPLVYAKALDRLAEFTLTIPTEDLSDGLRYMNAFLGVHVPMDDGSDHYNKKDAGHQVRYLETQDPELLDRIYYENYYDDCLHRQVLELWKIQKKILESLPEGVVSN